MTDVIIIHTTRPEDHDFNDDLHNALIELGRRPTFMSYLDAPQQVERLKTSRRIIISGSPLHYPAESAEILQPYLTSWLPFVHVPVLGICLGHQAMGLVFGATMRRGEEVEKGICTAEISKDHLSDPIFKGFGGNFEINSLHWASIAIDKAPRLVRLARSLSKPDVSTGCQNQIIRVTNRPIYGVQFHPEKSETGKRFLRNFLEVTS